MSYYEDNKFLGTWKYNIGQDILTIEKTGEIYRCTWKNNDKDEEITYLGIGIFIDNQLLISRFSKDVPSGGIGIYKPIGDLRSNSSLWASTRNPRVLGSGIAIRKIISESFIGNYKVRYFLEENESPVYDLNIVKSCKNDLLYSLNWSINDEIIMHGIGMINNEQMILACGGVGFNYEVVILDIEDNRGNIILMSKRAGLQKGNIVEEILTK